MALFILRFTLGITAIFQGAADFFDYRQSSFWVLTFALLAVVAGVALLVGLMTPLGAFVVFLVNLATEASMISSVNHFPLSSSLSGIYIIAISAAVVLLGPGAFSLDARMFGRREIIIPDRLPPEY